MLPGQQTFTILCPSIQALEPHVEDLALLAVVLAAHPSSPAALHLSRAAAELPELYQRAHLPALALCKRLLLLHATARRAAPLVRAPSSPPAPTHLLVTLALCLGCAGA